MLAFLPGPLRGILAALILAFNTLLCCTPLFVVALVKACVRVAPVQRACDSLLRFIHESWINNNRVWVDPVQWQVSGLQTLDYRHSYLVTSNHQSWVDIIVLQYQLNRRVQPLKFFLKQELIWVPVLGVAMWALGFPFMKRYTKAYLEKYPEKKGKDLQTTRRTCARFRHQATGIFNFAEGTRFNEAKHAQQQSPFRYLLKPKAGGIAFVLDAMGEQLQSLVNVTLHYPRGRPGFWDLLCGNVPEIVARFEEVEIPTEFIGKSYDQDMQYRQDFQQWINGLWMAKDALLEQLHREYPG